MAAKIGVTLFNKKTRGEFMASSRRHLGYKNKIHEFKAGDIILLNDIESGEVFGIVVLGTYDSGNVYREHHPLDIDIYSGDSQKYNKYDVKIDRLIPLIITFSKLASLCGKNTSDGTKTNIWKGTHLNFSKLFYKADDEEAVISKINILIETILSVQTL